MKKNRRSRKRTEMEPVVEAEDVSGVDLGVVVKVGRLQVEGMRRSNSIMGGISVCYEVVEVSGVVEVRRVILKVAGEVR